MTPDEIRSLYTSDYAASYDRKFLHSFLTAEDMRHECDLLRQLLATATTWLDVACGTGFFLEKFPQLRRTGIDLSPGMLAHAQSRPGNSEVIFREHDFRIPIPEFVNRFDLVSCMWYAYGYARTIEELCSVIDNLAAWVSPAGACFLPLADPDMISGQRIPYNQPTEFDGELSITGILWSYIEENGTKSHRHMLAPNIRFMCEEFQRRFDHVELVRYPTAEAGQLGRPAIVARGKRGQQGAVAPSKFDSLATRLGWPTLDPHGSDAVPHDTPVTRRPGVIKRVARRILQRLA